MRVRRLGFLGLLLAFLPCAAFAARYGTVQPELAAQLIEARRDLVRGDSMLAAARANAILMSGRPILVARASLDPNYDAALAEGIRRWNEAMGYEAFAPACGRPAQVQVSFQVDASDLGSEMAGFARWSRVLSPNSGACELQAEVQVRTTRPDGGNLAAPLLVHAICHELGHVLGLTDNPVPGRVMSEMDLDETGFWLDNEDLAELLQLHHEAEAILGRRG